MRVHPLNIKFPCYDFSNKEKISEQHSVMQLSERDVYSFLSSIGNYNLSFTSAKKPLYVIDRDGNLQKFDDRKSAQIALGIPIDGIDRCLQGKKLSSHGYGFIYANNIESINEKGESVVDKIKSEEKIAQIVDAIQSERTPKPFYCINLQDGSTQKFNERSDAVKTLSISKGNVAQCLQGKRAYTHNYTFVYADELETVDKDGNSIIDEAKLTKKIAEVTTFINSLDKPIPIYAIDAKGRYKKYPSKANAAKSLGLSTPAVLKVLDKEIKKTGGFAFVYPEEIETIQTNGHIVIDKAKLDGIVSFVFEQSRAIPIYAISSDGSYRKYSGIRPAARELSLESANIARCLKGEQKRVGDYTFIRATDVETIDENKKISVDVVKIKQLNDETLVWDSFVPVYTIDANGKYRRYENKKRAARAIGVEISQLQHCLQGRYNVVNGFALVRADEFEIVCEDGKTTVNNDILKEKYRQANKNSVYAVNPDGSYKKYNTQSQASKELGIRWSKISQCVNGISSMTAGKGFVKASDVETFENGKVVVNRALLKKFAQELALPRVKAVYVFDKNGKYVRFNSAKETSENIDLSLTSIKECLAGSRESGKGYTFVYAENFEATDNDGNIIVDYEKLDELSMQINPQVKKDLAKYGKIYALRGLNIKEFPNIRVAARELGIDEEKIIYILTHDRNFEDGKNSINGYVFTCEKDE